MSLAAVGIDYKDFELRLLAAIHIRFGLPARAPYELLALIKRADNGRWALPGGYAEVGSPPAMNALRELHEETGLDAAIERLVGVYDNREFGSVAAYQFYICLFRARITGGAPRPSAETTEVRLVDPDDLPEDMSALQRAMVVGAVANAPLAVFQ